MFKSDKKNNSDSLDELKKRLYTRGDLSKRSLRKGHLSPHEDAAPSSWNDSKEELNTLVSDAKVKMGFFKKIFLGSAIFFVLATLYAVYQFFGGGNIVSSRNINLSVIGPAFVSGGEELELQIVVENNNTVPLEFAELLTEYPKGAAGSGASSTPDMVRVRKTLEKISAGGKEQELVKMVLYGEEGKEQNVKFVLEYRVKGSNAIFRKETDYPVRISSAPVNLSLEAPAEINSGQEVTLKIKASSNSSKDVPKVLLEVNYPPGFLFKSADPKPAYGNNVWRLGDFKSGSSRSVRITGTISGEEGEERALRVLLGGASSDDDKSIGVVYNSIFRVISVHRPFLDAKVYLNSDPSNTVAVSGGREVRGEIIWKNNLPTRITDAKIRLKFGGNAFSSASVSSQDGFYNSVENSIIWDRNSVEDFQTVEPGSTGRLPFLFTPASLSSSGGVLNSPQVNMSVTVEGNVRSSDGNEGTVSITTEKTVKISTDLQLLSRSMHYSGPFNNTGPIPPIAETETTYTVFLTVTNSSNDVSGATVTMALPPYVNWAGETYPDKEDVSYNEGSRIVIWRLNTVYAGSGYGSVAREAAFKIKFLPSLSHVGSSVSLTGDIGISGTDVFSGAAINFSKNGLTTSLNGESGFREENGVVVSPN